MSGQHHVGDIDEMVKRKREQVACKAVFKVVAMKLFKAADVAIIQRRKMWA